MRISLLVQNVIPPALVSYFIWAWRRCTLRVAYEYLTVHLGRPWIGALYGTAVNILLPAAAVIYLRLYFLPSSQSLPPHFPPPEILNLETVFECTPPTAALHDGHALVTRDAAEDAHSLGLLSWCSRDKCAERWKPARARHCSECGVCRCGFDHHCGIFANCLTAPYLPAFLALCLIGPVVVVVLTAPYAIPLVWRASAAWAASYTAKEAQRWWAWRWSWIVPCGPVGRWGVGLALGWRALDHKDGGGPAKLLALDMGLMTLIGYILFAILVALAYSTVGYVRSGALTIDYERMRAYARALSAAESLTAKGLPVPTELEEKIARFAPIHWFFMPTSHRNYAGVVLRCLPHEEPYDLGSRENFQLLVSQGYGWRWILPWNAVRAGGVRECLTNWPIAPRVLLRLRLEAERVLRDAAGDNDGDEDGQEGDTSV